MWIVLNYLYTFMLFVCRRVHRNRFNREFLWASFSIGLEDMKLTVDNVKGFLPIQWLLAFCFCVYAIVSLCKLVRLFRHREEVVLEAEIVLSLLDAAASVAIAGDAIVTIVKVYFPGFKFQEGIFGLGISILLVWNATRGRLLYVVPHNGRDYRFIVRNWVDNRIFLVPVAEGVLRLEDAGVTEGDASRAAAQGVDVDIARSEDLKHDIDHLLENNESFTKQVSELLESGKTHLEELSNEFEEQIIMMHKEQEEKWQEEINELRLLDCSNEEADALLHNARTETNVAGSELIKQDIDHVLEKIETFTLLVSELRESGKTRIKELSNEFQELIIMIHKEQVEEWQELIKDLRLPDSSNEEVDALLTVLIDS